MNVKVLLILTITLVCLLFSSSLADQQTEKSKLDALIDRFYQHMFEFDPVYATQMGEHSLDHRYPDFSKKAMGRMVSNLKNLKGELRKIKKDQLESEQKIDYLLLEGSINKEILLLSRSGHLRDNPNLFSSTALAGIYEILVSSPVADSVVLESILKRLSDLPNFLKKARKSLDNPPQIELMLAEVQAEKTIVFFTALSEYFSSKFPNRVSEIQPGFAQAANALEEFSDLIDAYKLQKNSSPALGRENYNKLLQYECFLDYDSDSLLKLGEALFTQVSINLDSVQAIVDTLSMPLDLNYFVPQSFSRNDVLDYFQWEVDQTRKWIIENNFITMPRSIQECTVIETPEFLRNIIGGVTYHPPAPRGINQTAKLFIQPTPDSLSDADRSAFFRYCVTRGFKGSTVYDIYPGRHLLLESANAHQSAIRQMFRSRLITEGWALYCEQAVYESGFYGDDPRVYLKILNSERLHTARMLIDIKLHTGQFDYQQAVDWLAENISLPITQAEQEVNRCILKPTDGLSATLGKHLILQLKETYKLQAGENYNLQSFHDMLLSKGAIPPSLIFREMLDLVF